MFSSLSFSDPTLTSSAQIGIIVLLLFLLCILEFSSNSQRERVKVARRFLYPAIALCFVYFCLVVIHQLLS